MSTPVNNIESLIDQVETYGKSSIALSKLKLVQAISTVVPDIVTRIILMVILVSFCMLLSVAITLLIGNVMGELYYGFFIVAGFYLIVGVLLGWVFRNSIKKQISNSIIRSAAN